MLADGLVQLAHAFLARRALNKPRIKRIVEHGLISTPAVRIVVYVLLNLIDLVICLQVHADADVECLVLVGKVLVVGILHVATGKLLPLLYVDIVLDEVRIEVVDDIILALQVDDRTLSTLLVNKQIGQMPAFLATKASSAPKLGAICTIPVPSSVVT